MRYFQKSLICVLFVSLALVTGCSREPTEEINNAEEAVARAKNDPDAVNYAGNLITQAEESLELMYDEVDAKNYDAAIDHANNAIAYAERAINEGSGQAWQKRNEATAVMGSVGALLLETEQRIETAKAANLPLDFNSIDSDFYSARRTFDQARSAMSGNRYQEAIFLSNNVRSDLNSINQKLGNTAMSVSRKK
jgi:HEPN domain-containing protein